MHQEPQEGRRQRLRRLTHSRYHWWYLLLLVIVIIVASAMVIHVRGQRRAQQPHYRTTNAVAQGNFSVNGKIQPTQTQVLTLPDGRVNQLNVKNGDHVSRGQALLTVTNQESQDDALQIQGDVQKGQQDLQAQQQTINQLQQQMAKMSSSDDGYADLQAQLSQAQSAYRDAQAGLTVSQNRLQAANSRANQTLTAPYDGYVTVDNSKSGVPVVTIYSDTLEFQGRVSEYDYNKLHQGTTLRVTALATKHSQKSPVTFLSRIPVKSSGNNTQYELSANVDSHDFMDGQTAKAVLEQDEVRIPKSAVHAKHVFVKDGQRVHRTKVSGHAENSFFIVTDGIDEGDQVVTNSDRHLKNGMRIEQ
ncbi:MAG TPA: biotin/lipoyl-binding protein [Candidatus Limosilactobacillus merdipullorum]|uniref:Biotin/lipoyl-binding protein n=1 Tax=Candidatus Limosilactobacillus merdipullorum TaxID=2838653 RepID=A0A9D1QNS7_9LACO|nr:biotin/lipoyl-binding protein [Candidatus Limosilactobacillus merdipullorum]